MKSCFLAVTKIGFFSDTRSFRRCFLEETPDVDTFLIFCFDKWENEPIFALA